MKKIFCLIILFFGIYKLHAQVDLLAGIDGPTNVELNETHTYSIEGGFLMPAWSVSGGVIISETNNVFLNPPSMEAEIKWTSTGLKSVTFTNGLYSQTLNVNVQAPQPPPATPSSPSVSSNTCGNKTLTRGNPPSGVTWYWQTSSGGTSTSNSSSTYTVTSSRTMYLRARNNGNGLWSSSRAKSVTVNHSPAKPSTPSVSNTSCGPKTITRANPPSGVTWYWQGTNSNGYSTSNSSSTYSAGSSGTYYIRARSSAGCWSSSRSVSVLINPLPAAPDIDPLFTENCGSTEVHWGLVPVGETRYWQTSASGTSTTHSSSTYTVTSTGTIYLRTRSLSGCWSPAVSIAVNVKQVPSTPATPTVSTNTCGSKTVSRGNPPSGVTWYWQNSSSGTSTSNSSSTYTLNSSGTIYLRARNNSSGCWSSSKSASGVVIQPTAWYQDSDGDGFGNPGAVVSDCSQPAGYVADNSDCNDSNAAIHPNSVWYYDGDQDGFGNAGSTELVGDVVTQITCSPSNPTFWSLNNLDCDDSDPTVNPNLVWYRDQDSDGHGDPNVTTQSCFAPAGYVSNSNDCNDQNNTVYQVRNWYRDQDGDGKGDPTQMITQCDPPSGYVLNSDDCNDSNAALPQIWYSDADGDGYGVTNATIYDCTQPAGYVAVAGDCNDNDGSYHQEEAWYLDADNDGLGSYFDNPYDGGLVLNVEVDGVNVPMAEISCGPPQYGLDGSIAYVQTRSDCNDFDANVGVPIVWYLDNDGDGFGVASTTLTQCTQPSGYASASGDCNDNSANEFPGKIWYADTDGDGYGDPSNTQVSCTQPTGFINDNTDCDDTNAQIYPTAVWYFDEDQDGYGSDHPLAFTQDACNLSDLTLYAPNNLDCDDTNALVNPESVWYHDNDGDGFGDDGDSYTGCDQLDEYILVGGDCNDGSSIISPNTWWYVDSDNDGYGDSSIAQQQCEAPGNNYVINGTDCDDTDPAILNPRTWYVDQDGDGFGGSQSTTSCTMPTGYVANNGDCNDNDPNYYTETVGYIDVDGDGYGTGLYGEQIGPDIDLVLNEEVPGFGIIPHVQWACTQYVASLNDTVYYRNNYLDCYDDDPNRSVIKHYVDQDRDGFGDASDEGITLIYGACFEGFNIPVPDGYSQNNFDTDDLNERINPNTIWYVDSDGDGFGVSGGLNHTASEPPSNGHNYVLNKIDQCPSTPGEFSGCPNLPVNLDFTENYIYKRSFREAVNEATYLNDVPLVATHDVVDYIDGIGRPYQTNQVHLSANYRDIVQLHEYDNSGRKSKEYLPYVSEVTGGIDTDPLTLQQDFYVNLKGDNRPFSKTNFKDSKSNRVLEQYGPGEDWLTNDRAIRFDYDFNGEGEIIVMYGDSLLNSTLTKAFYPKNEMAVTYTYDEDSLLTVEVTNTKGQSILKKSQINENDWAETYYVYDFYGNLSTVIPPEATSRLDDEFFGQSVTLRQNFLNTWAFLYNYDERNRLVMKKVPGADSVFMVYDQWDRLVLSQDGNQRLNSQWLFTKYDQLNRPVMTGLMTGGDLATEMTAVQASNQRAETFSGAGINQYTNNTYPLDSQVEEYFTVTYYDNYDWDNTAVPFDNTSGLTKNYFLKGQVTGTLTKAEDGSWIRSAIYYDDKYRVIQTHSTNHLGGKDVVTNYLDFAGQVDRVVTQHSDGTNTTTITRRFVYDHAGRLLETYHQINNEPETLLAQNRYNAIGELIEKDMHAETGGVFVQSVDYEYNIRGWLTHLNNSDLSDSRDGDLFGMQLSYHEVDADLSNTRHFNGNISAMKWSVYNDQKNASISERGYRYNYDGLNRLLEANQRRSLDGAWANVNHFKTRYEYDRNGNIDVLERNADGSTFMDNLSYTYAGNQLLSVGDAASDTTGFYDRNTVGDDYQYDENGNMTQDLNKEINEIVYNHLNLPVKVSFQTAGDSITYLYDAAGIKLSQKVYKEGTLEKVTDYVGEFIYETDTSGLRKLQLIQHEEGRVIPNESEGSYDYQYHLKDHLGNVRVTFSTTPESYEMYASMEHSEEAESFNNYEATSASQPEANSGTHVFRNFNTQNDGLGLNTFLCVNKGDTIKASAYAYYSDQAGSYNLATGLIAGALFGEYSPNKVAEGVSATEGNFDQAFVGGTLLGGRSTSSDAPRAFINYIFFDSEMNYVAAGFKQISTSSNGVSSQVVVDPFIADQEGYIMVYLSNETQGSEVVVSWDDVEVYHGKTNVVSTQDYYPFGLTFNGSQRVASKKNFMNTFQDQEYEEETGWVKFKWRNHQPEIGRFFNVDPLAEDYVYNSVYAFSENRVVNGIELEGLEFLSAQENGYSQSNVLESVMTGTASSEEIKVANQKMGKVPVPEGGIDASLTVSIKQDATARVSPNFQISVAQSTQLLSIKGENLSSPSGPNVTIEGVGKTTSSISANVAGVGFFEALTASTIDENGNVTIENSQKAGLKVTLGNDVANVSEAVYIENTEDKVNLVGEVQATGSLGPFQVKGKVTSKLSFEKD